MSTTTGRKGSFLLVTFLLLIAILLEQFWLSRFLPAWLGESGRVQPMIVFLDIPLRLPVIDWIPVGALFIILYLVAVSYDIPRPHRGTILWNKGWALFAGWWILLLCIVAAGGLYYLVEDRLPRQVRNGIDSFGFRADIAVPFREDPIQLHGGMIMLIALLIGGRAFLICARLPKPVQIPVDTSIPETISSKQPVESLKQTVRRTAQEPAPAPAPATVRPCVVTGILEPRSS